MEITCPKFPVEEDLSFVASRYPAIVKLTQLNYFLFFPMMFPTTISEVSLKQLKPHKTCMKGWKGTLAARGSNDDKHLGTLHQIGARIASTQETKKAHKLRLNASIQYQVSTIVIRLR
ncbi:CLUMA_CG008761, isoform A [Clunio marinus]|uniref:CLUMA_CG008761, isoform A n=1 Tax=Clunio marinus TaxID=568069 RepID=A0A1J1I4G7_9DIPT|nr:CLUMA_CG008761, isoform A [Clunio marinus]